MNQYSGKKIYIALLDDHPIVRKGLEIIFSQEPDFELKGSFASRIDLINFLRTNRIDVLILDYLLGDEDIDGLPMIKQLMSNFPWLKILISSTLENTAIVRMALKAGVRGHIGKSRDASEVVDAVRRVAAGHICLSESMEKEFYLISEPSASGDAEDEQHVIDGIGRLDQLSARELEVLRLFLSGMSVLQISEKFSRSRKTVSGQKKSAMKKLGVKTDPELFLWHDQLL
ncbi:response regulator transcription factor [Enterobacter chuandaensis]|uniref:response regulator transcription factor n=1 Tax=Enterobacter TaxID=547 RepID=UPI000E2E68A8|nr:MULTISPECIES: response regulator transcription factor [Enterobacter]NIH45505.1 response regulator transcription factor [Enterobacter asburiae]TIM55125.1 MAG: response regulator transcription factor [Mesorhizobium sp.]ELH0000342.1 response regulator transcription factor [Enterobacter cloacae]MBE3287678.1 response regulator transcription factor [Enterobacter cloacae complex sp. P31C]MCE1398082.1 response regulator transcription factor [Enterobacter cloacae]